MQKMRKKLLQLSALLCLSFTNLMAETRIMVISDIHLLPDEYKEELNSLGDNKLSEYSTAILSKAVNNVIETKPDLLLVSGDMTFYGEKSGHELTHSILQKVTSAGIPVKVIPGNHDIMNPYSLDENHGNVNIEEFAEIYKDMGYEEGVARDKNSLSWATAINDSLAIIGLDANIYNGEYNSDGCLRKSTINWMKVQADSFHNEGKMVIAMVHYEIMDHFTKQISIMGLNLNVPQSMASPNSILNINHKHQPNIEEGEDAEDVTLDEIQQAFADADIHYVLTGHFHVHNSSMKTVQKSDGSDFDLYDFSTGGLTTYPCWMRTVLVNEGNGTATTTSSLLEMSLENGNHDLQAQAKKAVSILDQSYEKYGFTVSGLIEENMVEENYELYDGTEMYQDTTYSFPSLTYTRIFDNKKWQPLYVPFASTYSDWSDNFEIALPVISKAGAMFFTQITDDNQQLPANSLALVRLKSNKSKGRYSIAVSQTPVVIEPDYNDMELPDYKIVGVYNDTLVKNVYIVNGNELTLANDSSSIKPMRWYMVNNSPYNFESVSLYIDNEISSVNDMNSILQNDDKIYNIDGTEVLNKVNLPNGIYIINSKKVMIKK